MREEILLLIAIVGSLVGVAGLLMGHFTSKGSAAMAQEIAILRKQMDLFWTIIEKEIGKLLHSPHRAELDKFIEKNSAGEILNEMEVNRFVELLDEIANDPALPTGEVMGALVFKASVLARNAKP